MNKIIAFFKNHRIIGNLILMLIVTIVMIIGLNCWLHSYTRHDQATTLPSIKGLTLDEASQILAQHKLHYEIIDSMHNDRKEPGIILEQIPAPDSKIKEGRVVYITINATTPRQIRIPNLKNASVRQAETQLRSLGFKNVTIEYENSPYKDLVLNIECNNKEISAGDKVPVNNRIVLVVGSGEGTDNSYQSTNDTLNNESDVIEELTDSFFQ